MPTEPNDDRPQPIDGARALQLLREVVAERPDYVYPRDADLACYYVRDSEPSCVVGHVLVRAGRPIRLLEQNNTMQVRFLGQVFGLDEPARVILGAAQAVQDGQLEPWSRALAAAEEKAEQLGVTA